MLTIFGNLWINNPEKLRHMKDSLESFINISDNWIINVRGSLREEAIRHLKSKLKSRLTLFTLLDDQRGWSVNALEMLQSVKGSYILLWNEDHINLAPQANYKKIVQEMSNADADVLWYSWWIDGLSRAGYNNLNLNKFSQIDVAKVDKKAWQTINQPGYPFYIISMMGIFKKELFRKLLTMDTHMYPFAYTKKIKSFLYKLYLKKIIVDIDKTFDLINRVIGNQFRKFPEITPFNLEKEQYRTDILPLRIALSKRELFACIDDDLGYKNYSLISRGLYKNTKSVKNIIHEQN